jgi:diguanylate cyclase (GGDEF)-like protein
LSNSRIRSAARPGEQDVLLGFGLVAAFCLIVIGADAFLHIGHEDRGAIATIARVTAELDLTLLAVLDGTTKRFLLLSFPVLLVVSEVALSALRNGGGAVEYSGFLTLVFVYIGLTQARGVGPLFVLVVGPAWVVVQRPWSAELGVRLFLTLGIWLLISEVLAARTERARVKTKRLIVQAHTDVLTGLGSRLHLSDRIERMDGTSGSALLFIDLDGFKVINETYGHAAGDELLVAVGRRLQSALGQGDLAARLVGDEFVALLEGGTMGDAAALAHTLLSSLSAPYALSRGRVAITASIGIVEVVPPATAESVLRDADRAMSEAKAAGRNRISIYEGSMHDRMVRRLELETELRDALAQDQFEVHYQPVVHSATNVIIGAEALLRWRHPQRGLLTPDSFLSVAEEMGLMEPLGDWILRQACIQAKEWQMIDPARAFSIAVNLSAPEMFSADLIGRVDRALDESGLPGKLLVLEITERIMMADTQQARRQLQELRRLGVRIAIDDFGTGYSSLAYLRDLPIDILKVDRSFVDPLGADHQALALLRAIVGIANALDLDVVVEGAETAAQVEILDQLGCHIVQGFYYGRPTSAQELGNRLTWLSSGLSSSP